MKGEEFPGTMIVRFVGVVFIGYALVWAALTIADAKNKGVLGFDWQEGDAVVGLVAVLLLLGFWLLFEWRDRDP